MSGRLLLCCFKQEADQLGALTHTSPQIPRQKGGGPAPNSACPQEENDSGETPVEIPPLPPNPLVYTHPPAPHLTPPSPSTSPSSSSPKAGPYSSCLVTPLPSPPPPLPPPPRGWGFLVDVERGAKIKNGSSVGISH